MKGKRETHEARDEKREIYEKVGKNKKTKNGAMTRGSPPSLL